MSQGFLNGLYIIPILAVLILVHELGHFFAARAVGVKVEEFGIGIPPRLKGWNWRGVLWSVNWIPFGGFVRVLGEDGKNMDPDSMNSKPPLQRAFFIVAGSAMNFLLAIVLMIFVVGVQGVASTNVYIEGVAPRSPAEAAGWRPGDRIVEVAGAPVEDAEDIGGRAREFAGRPMSVVIERGGETIETTVTPRANPPAGEGPAGVVIAPVAVADVAVAAVAPDSAAARAGLQPGDRFVFADGRPVSDQLAFAYALEEARGGSLAVVVERDGAERDVVVEVPAAETGQDQLAVLGLELTIAPRFEHVPAAEVIPLGFSEAIDQTAAMLAGIRGMVTGAVPFDQIAGPIGMGQLTSQLVAESPLPLWFSLAQLTILLSLNLGVLNLLPLPALDGGRLLFIIVEMLRGGKRIPPEREGVVHLAGLVILIGLMFVIAFRDVGRIVGGGSFLP